MAPFVVIVILYGCHFVQVLLHDSKVEHVMKQAPAAVHRLDPHMKRRLSADQAHPSGPVRAPLPVLLGRAAIASIKSTTHFLYLAYPVITTVAFEAFPCHEFDEGSWLMADVAVRCHTPEHEAIRRFAWVAVLVYPVGLLILTALLLGYYKEEVMGAAPPTEVSTAISFLYRHFVPGCYYWELFELLRRFLLVGVAVVIQPGSVAQLTFATLFSMMFSVFEHQLRPYKSPYDNFLAISASFTLSILFFSCVLLKLGVLVEQNQSRAQQDWVLHTAAGQWVWAGNRWGSSPDGTFAHDLQTWLPMTWDDSSDPPRPHEMLWTESFELHA